MTKHRDTILGVAVIVIAVILFVATFGIREFTRTSLGADFVPRVTAFVLAALGAVLIFREWKRNRLQALQPATQPAATASSRPIEGLTGALPVILNILLFGGYLLLLEKVGFIILTPIYMFLQILLLTNPKKMRFGWFAVLSVVVGIASFYLFTRFFQVMLPNGILE